MRRQKFVLAGATLLAASLAMSACGTRTETPGTGEGSEAAKVAKIGVIAPLSGDLSALGLGIQNSVDLAVKQANEAGAIPGWTLEVDAQDDQATPDVGKNAATKLAGDDTVIGVVGTLNSSVVPVGAAGALQRQHRPGLAGQHQPDPDPGAGPGQPHARLPRLLPHLHHRRRPGPVRGQVPAGVGYQDGGHDPRQEGVRPGPGGRVQRGLQVRWRHHQRGRDDQPGRQELLRGDQQGQERQPAGRVLRR